MFHRKSGHIESEDNQKKPKLQLVESAETKADAAHRGSILNDASASHTHSLNVLIVDDRKTSRQILAELLIKTDCALKLHPCADPLQALEQARKTPPDLVVTDYRMPFMNGIELMQQIRMLPDCHDVPVMFVTVCEDREVRYRALQAGANDFLVRPLDQYECQARCYNLLVQRKQKHIMKTRLQWLEKRVQTTSVEVRGLEQELLLRLARAGEYRDEITGRHVLRMAKYSRLIAENLGLSAGACEEVELAAPMHDIGKIGVADEILLKPGKLTGKELQAMRAHVRIGYEILKDSESQYMQLGAVIALNHHERFDGSGYPNGLAGNDIPLIARIVSVADVFDALTSSRPYKGAWTLESASHYLRCHSGTHFDPMCVDAFLRNMHHINDVKSAFM